MVDAWFEHISSQEHRLGPDERQSLKDFLNGLTSADEAAKAISSAYSTLPGTAIGSFVCDLWLLLIDAAKEIPSSQDKLVQLVATIGQLSDFTRCGKVFRVAGPEKQRPWRDPPLFADLVGEKSYGDLTQRGDLSQAERKYQWLNHNAFAARLLAKSICDLKYFALFSFRNALEEEPWDPSAHPESSVERARELFIHRPTTELINVLVPATAQWIFHAGYMIFHSQDDWEAFEHPRGDLGVGGDLWKGKHGFCRERWNLWKTRFAWVHGLKELTEATRAVAKQAVEMMERIEQNPDTEL